MDCGSKDFKITIRIWIQHLKNLNPVPDPQHYLRSSQNDQQSAYTVFGNCKLCRYLVVSGGEGLVTQQSALERFRLDPRFDMLILAAVTSFTGLNIPQG